MLSKGIAILILAVIYLANVNCDLPIHVTTSDIVGKWRFDYTSQLDYWIDGCGSGIPNKNTQNLQPSLSDYNKWLRERNDGELNSKTLILTDLLLSSSEITNKNLIFPGRDDWTYLVVKDANTGEVVGRWTMVYDEGFEVTTNDMIIFGFMKYNLLRDEDCNAHDGDNENSSGETLCYETDPTTFQIGWYYMGSSNKRGCINGIKEESLYGNNIIDLVRNRVEIPIRRAVENSIKNLSNSLHDFANKHNSNNLKNWRARSNFSVTDIAFSHHPFYMNYVDSRKIHFTRMAATERSAFIEVASNSYRENGSYSFNISDSIFACNINRIESNDDLPKSFSVGDPFTSDDFNEYPYNQGNCGSCYAVSSVYILAKRTEIMLNKLTNGKSKFEQVNLSSQSVLSCSPFNQGCEGGYPFLVGKQAEEVGIPIDSCMTYYADSNQECNFNPFISANTDDRLYCGKDERMYAENYGYVGGCYECSDEKKMMREIYDYGPIAVALHIGTSLLVYENGIYDSVPDDHKKYCDIPNKQLNGWEYTNHAISIVGWGEENGIPYWIIRNSWGSNWGNRGYAKIRRGKNIGGIENQAVFIDPSFSKGLGLTLLSKYVNNESNETNIETEEIQLSEQGSQKANYTIGNDI
ncbi:preprocathepsin c precursor [Cryptosporidium bovis]|uniref:preprocathepsin c precursor n=1 Tax=Cryptosporidium bovis TaxID=310047 RepID=UPI00351A6F3C|nr:preprocathepsin c precursor [Cryptosporidium bovis]